MIVKNEEKIMELAEMVGLAREEIKEVRCDCYEFAIVKNVEYYDAIIVPYNYCRQHIKEGK